MQYKIGTQTINLADKDLKGTGGQGSVYLKGSKAYKIYHDRSQALSLGKMQELAAIQDSRVIRPLELIEDKTGPIGYSMLAIPTDTYVLCQFFPPVFRIRMGLDTQFAAALVEDLRTGITSVHKANILIVDLNEMNFLFAISKPTVYFIDVDSYQTQHYHATALMESVRDRHGIPNQFNEGTDWFAFAILSFQIFTGIHPYKGKHTHLKSLDDRMHANISVLNASVAVPGACLPFDVIPDNYRKWYENVFERGERSSPPTGLAQSVVVWKTISLAGTGKIQITNILHMTGDIMDYLNEACVTSGTIINAHHQHVATSLAGEIRLFHSQLGTAAAYIQNGLLQIMDIDVGIFIPAGMACNSMVVCDGMLVVQSGESLYSCDLLQAGNNVLVIKKAIANVLQFGTQLYDGVAMQDLLGAKYATILSRHGTYQIKLDELRGCRILSAKHDRGILVIIAENGGYYNRHIYRFDATYQQHDYRVVNDVGISEANFCVLDSGVVLLMREDDSLEVFSSKVGSASISSISDPAINSACRLMAHGTKALYIHGTRVDYFTMI